MDQPQSSDDAATNHYEQHDGNTHTSINVGSRTRFDVNPGSEGVPFLTVDAPHGSVVWLYMGSADAWKRLRAACDEALAVIEARS